MSSSSVSNVVTTEERVNEGDPSFDFPWQVRYSGAGDHMADTKRSGFADLLDGTFSMISRTWMTSLIIGGVLFIPAAFLFGWAYNTFMDSIKDMAGSMTRESPTEALIIFGKAYLWILLAVLVQGLVYLFVRACVTEHSARVLRGEPANSFDVALHVIKHRYAPLLGQRVLQIVILSIALGGAAFVTGLVIGVAAALKLRVLAAILGSVLGLAGLAVVIWVAVRYRVTLESMVIDGSGIEQSFDTSMALVRRKWWRVFGYTLLFGLMVSFASALIATPIMFFSTIRQFMHGLENLLTETSRSRSFNAVFLQLMAGMGRRFGILQYAQSLLSGFVTPVFMTLLFTELKKQSVPEPQRPEPLPAGTGT